MGVEMESTYKPVLLVGSVKSNTHSTSRPIQKPLRVWSEGSVSGLRDCFESTDWGMFKEESGTHTSQAVILQQLYMLLMINPIIKMIKYIINLEQKQNACTISFYIKSNFALQSKWSTCVCLHLGFSPFMHKEKWMDEEHASYLQWVGGVGGWLTSFSVSLAMSRQQPACQIYCCSPVLAALQGRRDTAEWITIIRHTLVCYKSVTYLTCIKHLVPNVKNTLF